MSEVVLHSFWRSSCSWRVRAALEIKKIPYRYVPIDIVKQRDQDTETYSRISPMQKVPSLLIDGQQLSESYNIVQYLEETRPASPLLPREAKNRATVREVTEMIQSGIQPLQNVGVLQALPVESEEKRNWARKWIVKGLQAVENRLKSSAGKYCFGDTVTIADIFLEPQLFNAVGYEVDLKSFPTINRVHANLIGIEAFIKSHPFNMPDAPPDVSVGKDQWRLSKNAGVEAWERRGERPIPVHI